MNYKLLILASSALLMGACGDNDRDVNVEIDTPAETQSDYVGAEDVDTANETGEIAPDLQTTTTDPYEDDVPSTNLEGDTIGPETTTDSDLTPGEVQEGGMPETVPAPAPEEEEPTPQ